jgi:4-methyl-5(b-hydroxyethyl)-thiazole monophosphate biosynthesis
MSQIITVLAPGFEETEAITFIDLLRRAGITVTVLGLESREVTGLKASKPKGLQKINGINCAREANDFAYVTGSHNITVVADKLFADFRDPFDGIVLPGGMPGTKNLANSIRLLELIRETHERGGLCAAICAAPIVLAKAGILTGRKATCYPGFEKELTGARFVEDVPVVRDRNVITSRGVGTAIPFALELISYLMNPGAAEKVKNSIVYK